MRQTESKCAPPRIPAEKQSQPESSLDQHAEEQKPPEFGTAGPALEIGVFCGQADFDGGKEPHTHLRLTMSQRRAGAGDSATIHAAAAFGNAVGRPGIFCRCPDLRAPGQAYRKILFY